MQNRGKAEWRERRTMKTEREREKGDYENWESVEGTLKDGALIVKI